MSGLGEAAAVIGITDVALRGIKGLYDFFQDLQDAREELPQIWNEVSYLQSNLSSLEFLSKADEDTLKEVRATGITQARMLDMAVGIFTLKLIYKSEAERGAEMSALKQKIDDWKHLAEQKQEMISASLKTLDESEDSAVVDELDEEESVLKTFVDHSGQTAERLQAIKLNQTIRGINTEDSEVRLGMPASVVDKVAQQSISDVTSKNKSKVTVGIW